MKIIDVGITLQKVTDAGASSTNSIMVGDSGDAQAPLHISGSDKLITTTSLLVEDEDQNDLFKILNSGVLHTSYPSQLGTMVISDDDISTTLGTGSVVIGLGATSGSTFTDVTGSHTVVGYKAAAGMNGTSGDRFLTAVGYKAGEASSNGNSTYVGAYAGSESEATSNDNRQERNAFFGAYSGQEYIGAWSALLGTSAGYQAAGDGNVFVGVQAGALMGASDSISSHNIVIGYSTGVSNTATHTNGVSHNTLIGDQSVYDSAIGDGNTILGSHLHRGATSSISNTVIIGSHNQERLRINSTGQFNFNGYTSTTEFNSTTMVGLLGFDSSGNILTVDGGGLENPTLQDVTTAGSSSTDDIWVNNIHLIGDEINFDVGENGSPLVFKIDALNTPEEMMRLQPGTNPRLSVGTTTTTGILNLKSNVSTPFILANDGTGNAFTVEGSGTIYSNYSRSFSSTNISNDEISGSSQIVNIGWYAMQGSSTNQFSSNTTIGAYAGYEYTSSQDNVIVGNQTANRHDGAYNTFMGNYAAAYYNGDYNTVLGYNAGKLESTPTNGSDNNIIIGHNAASLFQPYVKGSENNVIVGTHAAYSASLGDNNVFIGPYVQYESDTALEDTIILGVSGSERLRIDDDGLYTFNSYGVGNYTAGTPAYILAVSSSGDVIETTLNALTGVDGSGTANYVPKWSDADTLTDSVMYDDGTNIGIGTTTVSAKLHLVGGAVDGGGTTLLVENSANTDILKADDNGVIYASTLQGGRISIGQQGSTGDAHFGASGWTGGTTAEQDYGFYAAHNAYRDFDGDWHHSRTNAVKAVRLLGSGGGNGGNQGFSFDYSDNVGTAAITWTNLMQILPSGNVGIGVTDPSEKLEVNGNVKADSFGVEGSASNKPTRVMFPGGAEHYPGGGAIAGQIVITLPQKGTDTMLSFTVKIFDYSSNETIEVKVAGYNGSGGWGNCTALVYSDGIENKNLKVRFGHDGTNDIVIIGETDSTWAYPQIAVTDFIAGFGNTELTKWNDGWDIDVNTTTTYTILSSQTKNNTQVNNWYLNGGDLVLGGGASNVAIGITTATEKLTVEGNIDANGYILIKDSKIVYQENTDVDSAAVETIATVAKNTYDCAFFDYVIKNGTNLRAGTVTAVHDGTNVEYVETSTNDLGDTSDVTLSVDIDGNDLRLRATVTSDDWSIKTLTRTL